MNLKNAFIVLILLVASSFHTCFAESESKKSINFEDELIEGINRKPLDSFNQLSEQDRKKKDHLYHKRSGFNDRDRILNLETGGFQ